ncbi:hypothetical protein VNO80_15976 [Phaseolus coccineus]|uniref:Uncharacterized protein n=1 Tax=Phaseolus coccineus TaxID=3886 RepID=A0AAN9ML87_PHACN
MVLRLAQLHTTKKVSVLPNGECLSINACFPQTSMYLLHLTKLELVLNLSQYTRTSVSIPNGPSALTMKEVAWGLARYAAISQIDKMPESEHRGDGGHYKSSYRHRHKGELTGIGAGEELTSAAAGEDATLVARA